MRLKKVRSEYAPWLTGNLKTAMYHRDYLRKMAVKHNSPNSIMHVKDKGIKLIRTLKSLNLHIIKIILQIIRVILEKCGDTIIN